MGFYTSTKTWNNLPCSHRQHLHDGHCAYIHGYSRSFTCYFACRELTPLHFVVDFGDLKEVKTWLEHLFDHTMLVNEDDPELATFIELHRKGICDLRILPNVGMEGTSHFVFEQIDRFIRYKTNGRAWLYKIETRENDKNSAIYEVEREGLPADHYKAIEGEPFLTEYRRAEDLMQ